MGRMKEKAAATGMEAGIDTLLQMFTYARPAYSKAEQTFCATFLDNIPGMRIDLEGNRILRVGSSPVLWSSHTDTVHKRDGKQRIVYGDGVVSLATGSPSSCLGADCTAGVWIMREMIKANVPGLYIFHSGEEIGGVGSSFIATRTPELLDGIDYAIAFDRKGAGSVITHQGDRCCSTGFARDLARQLGGSYAPDSEGIFTDTANYVGLVPECTNLSVGYYNAHSAKEYQDVNHLVWLLGRMKSLDVSSLPVMRCVDDVEEYHYGYSTSIGGGDLTSIVKQYPDVAAAFLEEMGFSHEDFRRYLERNLPF